MIKAQELRLGNLVGLNNRVVMVESLTRGFNYFGAEERDRGHLIGLYHVLFEKADGIPLTEEWLVRFGFEEIKETVFMSEKGRLILCKGDVGYFMSDINGQPYSNNQEFVHQLQNLYYALTGEELTIKP